MKSNTGFTPHDYLQELVEEAYIKATKADPKAETGYANLARLYV